MMRSLPNLRYVRSELQIPTERIEISSPSPGTSSTSTTTDDPVAHGPPSWQLPKPRASPTRRTLTNSILTQQNSVLKRVSHVRNPHGLAVGSRRVARRNYEVTTPVPYYSGLRPSETVMLRPRILRLLEGWNWARALQCRTAGQYLS